MKYDFNLQKKGKILRLPDKNDIVVSFALFLASRASVIGMYPFAVAMFAAVFDKSAAYIAIAVIALGSISCGMGLGCIKYILAVLFFWLYARLREDYRENRIFSSAVCGASVFSAGCIIMILNTSAVYDFVALAIESILSAFVYVVFDIASNIFRRKKSPASRTELIGGAVCIGIFISGFQDINIIGINVSHCVISYIVMSIALGYDTAVSGSGGLCTGLICSLNEKASMTLIGFYGLSGIICSLFRGFKKYGVVLGFLASGAVITLQTGNVFNIPVSILEMLISSALFLCVPEKAHMAVISRINGIISPDITDEDNRISKYVNERLNNVSRAFTDLSETFRAVSDKRMRRFHREAATIVQETVERVCKNCAACSVCWQEDFGNTWKTVFSLLDTYEKKGFCSIENCGSDFLAQCLVPERFLAEFNHSYELFRIETIHKGEAIITRNLVSEQYELFSKITKALAERVSEGFETDPETEAYIADKLGGYDISVRDVRVLCCDNLYEIYISSVYPEDPEPICGIIGEMLDLPVFFEEMTASNVMKFTTSGVYMTDVGISQVPKNGETVCGDTVFRFKTDDNKYYVIICDGMGSGPGARSESLLTGSLLEKFLQAGMGAKTAITMVNSSLALKQDRETFSCVDMVSIDLVSGKTEFYKIGGTASFIRHDDEVESVYCESLPLGILDSIATLSITKNLGDDDVIVMMSDGVSDTEFGVFTSDKIKKLLNSEEKTASELSAAILQTALKRRNNIARDDMSVVTIQLHTSLNRF